MSDKHQILFSHARAKALTIENLWKKLETISLEELAKEWLGPMPRNTKRNYLSGLKKLHALEILCLEDSLQQFSLYNHDDVLDKISAVTEWSDCTKQARAALYISLTRFLYRKTDGIIKRAVPRKGEVNTTFFRVREKVKTEPLGMEDWKRLIEKIKERSLRDSIITKLCIQGARRIQEVLDLQIEQVNPEKRQVTFRLNKTRGLIKNVIVTIPESAMKEISLYAGRRKQGPLFITSTGKKVRYTQIMKALQRAAKACDFGKKIHTHVLRTSAISYLRSLGLQDFEIQRLTGHASTQMLNAYDKSSIENNSSKRVALI
jgi:integrase